MGTGDLCQMPPPAVRLGRARQSSETGPCGDCRRVLWLPGPRCQYFGEIRFIEKPRIQDEGDRHVTKRSSDHRVTYPEVKVQVRDLVQVVDVVAPLPHGGLVPGKILFIKPQEVNVHRRPVPGAPAILRHDRVRQSSGTVWGLKKGPVGTGPAGSVYGDNLFYREIRGARGSPCG